MLAKVVFKNPYSGRLHTGKPKIISSLILHHLQSASGLNSGEIAKKMKCSGPNVRMMLAPSMPYGSQSLRTLARFAKACGSEIVVTFRRQPRRRK